jgi:hypothetical protein
VAAVSIDTYAATNPAFCSVILYSFLEGFSTTNSTGIPFPLMLLPIPIVLTREIADSFEGTNVRTGLLTWATRSPEITIGLRERIQNTSDFSKQGLLFGSRFGLFSISDIGRVFLKPDCLKKNLPTTGRTYITEAIKLARRLGVWVGEAGSTETVFIALGVNR